jgi:hypothetical protein
MSSSGGWVFYFLFLPLCVLIPAIVLLYVLATSCYSSLACSDAFLLLTAFVLGLVPGFVVVAYAHFKAATRYFRDAPREAVEKAVKDAADKAAAARKATVKANAARLATTKANEAKEVADQAVKDAAGADVDKKRRLAEKATAKLEVAQDFVAQEEAAEQAAKEASREAAANAAAAKKALARAEAARRSVATADALTKAVAKDQAEKARAEAAVARRRAEAALEAAVVAQKAASLAQAKAEAAKGTEGETQAAAEATSEADRAQAARAAADAALDRAARATKEAADAEADWRSSLLNPKGLQQTTLERAGKIREDEYKGFTLLAILLVFVCWVALTACWGGWLDFSATIKDSDVALRLSSAGAYVYVLILLGRRNFQRDITPGSILWCCITLAVGPVLALVVAYIWEDSLHQVDLGPLNEKALFFFAGLAPRHVTALLLEVLRRIMLAVAGKPALVSRLVPLQQVRGITPEVEERLEEEGILDVINLAMADPLRLLRNTSFDKFQILTWIDEALLLYTFPQHWQALELEGITGAMDLAWYITRLPDTRPLADQIHFDPESLQRIVQRLAEDAQVQLIWILYDLDNPNE